MLEFNNTYTCIYLYKTVRIKYANLKDNNLNLTWGKHYNLEMIYDIIEIITALHFSANHPKNWIVDSSSSLIFKLDTYQVCNNSFAGWALNFVNFVHGNFSIWIGTAL